MNIEQIKAFVTSVETGSLSAAARHLQKTRAAISTSVSTLEGDLGVSLFDRTGRYPVLTPAGEQLLASAKATLKMTDFFLQRAYSLARGVEPMVTMALDETVRHLSIRGMLKTFEETFPETKLSLLMPASAGVLSAIKAKQATIGISLLPEKAGDAIAIKPFFDQGLQVIVDQGHEFAAVDCVSTPQLAGSRQVVLGIDAPNTLMHQMAEEYWVVDSFEAMLECVQAGIGWAVVPNIIYDRLVVGQSGRYESVISIHVEYEFKAVQTGFVWHKDMQLGPAAQWLQRNMRSLLLNTYA